MSVTFNAVRKTALSFDDVEESTSYGTPAFKVGGALFARLRPELDSLVIKMDFSDREELMAEDPETYFITDHYLNYQWVLIRLSSVHPDALRDLLWRAFRFAKSKSKNRKTPKELFKRVSRQKKGRSG